MLCIEWYSHSNNFLPSEFVIWSKWTMSTSEWREQLRRTSYRVCKGFTSEMHAGTEDNDWMIILNDKCIQPCLLFRMKYEIQEATWTSRMTCTITIEYVLFCAIKNKTFILQFICVKIPVNSHSGRVKRTCFRNNLALVNIVEPIRNTIYLKWFLPFVYV